MTRSLSNSLTVLLAGIGCLLAMLLTVESLAPSKFSLPCSTQSNGCAGTLNSDYSHFGPIPTATFGLAMYLTIVGLCARRRKLLEADRLEEEARIRAYTNPDAEPPLNASMSSIGSPRGAAEPMTPVRSQIRQCDLLVWLIACAGFAISWWLQYTAIFELHSFCPYCFTSALIVTAIFGFASSDHLLDGRPMSGEQKMLTGVLAFVLVLMSFMVVPEALRLINTRQVGPVKEPSPLRDVLITSDMHTLGPANAKYTIVEFADYLCPHCAEASKIIPDLMTKRPDVRIAFRSYPLGFPKVKFKFSDTAAYAAEAAGLQGKFWEMHDLLFKNQDQIKKPDMTNEVFADFATQLDLNVKKFVADMNSAAVQERVANDHTLGDRARMSSTPTFFVITPNKVTSFIGGEELAKAMNDPKSTVWE
jgi:protein-disulfide isomerase/uncharacterized membrane protein